MFTRSSYLVQNLLFSEPKSTPLKILSLIVKVIKNKLLNEEYSRAIYKWLETKYLHRLLLLGYTFI